MNKILKEPLLHFLLIGLALFIIYANINDKTQLVDDNTLHVSKSDLQKLSQSFVDGRGREPDEIEMKKLLDRFIKNEIFYLEALKKGLDKNDVTIKDHLSKKMKFVLDDLSMIKKPTEVELQKYLTDNADMFKEYNKISFNQVMFKRDEAKKARGESIKFLEKLRTKKSLKVANIGDLIEIDEHKLEKALGHEFGDEIFHAETKQWLGPFATKYGYHLVYIHSITEGEVPKLSDIKDTVEDKLIKKRRLKANKVSYKKLKDSYEIIID